MQKVFIVSTEIKGSKQRLEELLAEGWKIASVTSGVTTVALACKGYDVAYGYPQFLVVLEKEDC